MEKKPRQDTPPSEQNTEEEGVIRTPETDNYGDESDEPIVKRKKKKKKSRKRRKTFSEKNFRRHFSLLEFIARSFTTDKAMAKKKGHFIFLNHYVSWKLLVALGILFVLIIYVYYDNNSIAIDEQTVNISGLDSNLVGFRALVISDLNGVMFGDGQAVLVNSLKSVKFDVALLVGDMVGKGGDSAAFLELVRQIGPKKVYFIAGDCDPEPVLSVPRDIVGTLDEMVLDDWIISAQKLEATYVDSPTAVSKNGGTVWITPVSMMNVNTSSLLKTTQDQVLQETEGMLSGLASDYDSLPVTSYREKNAREAYDTVAQMKASDLHICLAHEPPCDSAVLASASHLFDDGKYLMMPDIIVAGHYCAGVWRVPLLGAVYVQSNVLPRYGWFPDNTRVRGIYSMDDVKVYVTRGLSVNGALPMSFRLFNKPGISLITFQATSSTNMLG